VDEWGIARLVTLGARRRMQPAELKFCLRACVRACVRVEELPARVNPAFLFFLCSKGLCMKEVKII
jgi:hypothetical protein